VMLKVSADFSKCPLIQDIVSETAGVGVAEGGSTGGAGAAF